MVCVCMVFIRFVARVAAVGGLGAKIQRKRATSDHTDSIQSDSIRRGGGSIKFRYAFDRRLCSATGPQLGSKEYFHQPWPHQSRLAWRPIFSSLGLLHPGQEKKQFGLYQFVMDATTMRPRSQAKMPSEIGLRSHQDH